MCSVSIICPCLNEEKYIAECTDSLLAQDYPMERAELLFVDGGSTDNTREILEEYRKKTTQLQILDNPHKTAPYAMNIGIQASRGKYIIRVDAHTIYPCNYVSTLLHYLETLPDAQNVGACCRTLPAKKSLLAKAIAIGCSHPLGVGASLFRIGTRDIIEVSSVPFGCWRREWLDKVGLFDEELTRNQDDEFNARTIQHGGKIYLIPQLIIDYIARDTLKKTYSMFYQYGLFKPLVNKKLKHPATIRQFIPMLFVLGLTVGAIIATIWPPFGWYYLTGILLYLGATSAVAIQQHNAYLPIVFLTMHIAYGVGYIQGLLKLALHKPFNVESNH